MATNVSAPLSEPLYGASFGQAIARFFKKYATFSGRASRSEYWWVALAGFLVSIVLWLVQLALAIPGATYDAATGRAVPGPGYGVAIAISVIWSLAIIVPGLAVVWRRLHDTNRSGAFYFLVLIPLVGPIILLVFLVGDSNPAGARFDR